MSLLPHLHALVACAADEEAAPENSGRGSAAVEDSNHGGGSSSSADSAITSRPASNSGSGGASTSSGTSSAFGGGGSHGGTWARVACLEAAEAFLCALSRLGYQPDEAWGGQAETVGRMYDMSGTSIAMQKIPVNLVL